LGNASLDDIGRNWLVLLKSHALSFFKILPYFANAAFVDVIFQTFYSLVRLGGLLACLIQSQHTCEGELIIMSSDARTFGVFLLEVLVALVGLLRLAGRASSSSELVSLVLFDSVPLAFSEALELPFLFNLRFDTTLSPISEVSDEVSAVECSSLAISSLPSDIGF
jgi:hypothetical protein